MVPLKASTYNASIKFRTSGIGLAVNELIEGVANQDI